MIGQNNLLRKIDSFVDFPHSIILVGIRGSEQEEVCKYISRRFRLEYNKLDEINDDIIFDINSRPEKNLYVFDSLNLSEKDQNVLLKLFEEPNENTYIIILTEYVTNILDTIKTRGIILNMDTYTKDDLIPLIKRDQDLVLSLVQTPGLIEVANHNDLPLLKNMCEKMIDAMPTANYSNALSIANKINFKDSYDKFDLYLFIKMLKIVSFNKLNKNVYNATKDLDNLIWSITDKERYFTHFITTIWKDSRTISLQD